MPPFFVGCGVVACNGSLPCIDNSCKRGSRFPLLRIGYTDVTGVTSLRLARFR